MFGTRFAGGFMHERNNLLRAYGWPATTTVSLPLDDVARERTDAQTEKTPR